MIMSDKSSPVAQILTAFVVGTVVGAGIALLYAPNSGKETRDLLARRAKELKDKVGDSLEDAKEMIYDKKAKLAAALEAGKQAMREAKSEDKPA
jgi:gas vesicle protein